MQLPRLQHLKTVKPLPRKNKIKSKPFIWRPVVRAILNSTPWPINTSLIFYPLNLFGRAFLEEAHLYLSKNNLTDALRAYQRASEANPALLAAWRQQIQLLEKTENKAALRLAEQQLAYHESLPAPLLRAKHLLYEGRLAKAEALCKSFMQENPRHVDGMRLLADIFRALELMLRPSNCLARPHNCARMTAPS